MRIPVFNLLAAMFLLLDMGYALAAEKRVKSKKRRAPPPDQAFDDDDDERGMTFGWLAPTVRHPAIVDWMDSTAFAFGPHVAIGPEIARVGLDVGYLAPILSAGWERAAAQDRSYALLELATPQFLFIPSFGCGYGSVWETDGVSSPRYSVSLNTFFVGLRYTNDRLTEGRREQWVLELSF